MMVTPGSTAPAFREPTTSMARLTLLLRLLLLLTLLSGFWFPTGAGAHRRVSISVLKDNRMPGYRITRLRCDDNLILEPKHFVWSTTNGVLPPSAVPSGNWLLFKSSNEPIDTTIICRVFSDQDMFMGKKRIKLPGFSREQLKLNPLYLIVLYLAMGLEVLVLGLLLCFWCYRKRYQKQYRASKNVQNRLNRVPPEIRWQRPLADTETVLKIGVAAVLETNPSEPEGSPLHQSNWRGECNDDDNDEGIFEVFFCQCLQGYGDGGGDENGDSQ